MTVIFVDTETTGLDPERHEVWEIALIEEDGTEHEWRMKPLPMHLPKADPAALRINRFYQRALEGGDRYWSPDSPSFIAAEVALLTAGAHLVGAVPSFDAAFLERFLRARGFAPAWHYHLIDVETLAVGYIAHQYEKATGGRQTADRVRAVLGPPWSSYSLGNLLRVPPPEPQHTAIADARWARAMYLAVMGKQEKEET